MMTAISTYNYNKDKVNNGNRSKRQANDRRVERMMLRLAIVGVFFIVLFFGFMLMKGFAGGGEPAAPMAGEKVIVVGAGDTLWKIAGTVREEGDDLRRIVYNLKERNQLSSSMLKVGQTLIVPAD
ncbi:LysM peptidoglycan-binding domain-containing protein [Paenibacillus spongiae]|uniref:LysM peptidoglycan-binding domain-containing protein n=1 Tax=Paenibacillus spongiae TaxID=2909671 RepID=A0ABY5S495_9BACL|nr:LysM peptidoglycan-binding domain-containing protein [Paenibacillus spongiae]UVI27687.1 LysM peptidoglycan-binding domain-containing protein [Paenibacillus spongiae]